MLNDPTQEEIGARNQRRAAALFADKESSGFEVKQLSLKKWRTYLDIAWITGAYYEENWARKRGKEGIFPCQVK